MEVGITTRLVEKTQATGIIATLKPAKHNPLMLSVSTLKQTKKPDNH